MREPSASSAWRESAARGRHRHPRRAQLRIEPVDVGRRRHRELAGDRGEGGIAPHLLGEMLELDARNRSASPIR